MKRILLFVFFWPASCSFCFAQGVITRTTYHHPIRVACVGASTTYGAGIANISRDAFPAQLGRILGKNWDVRNFGVNSTGVLLKGDLPYRTTAACRAALAFQPDVVILNLGVNDTKPENWKYKNAFLTDYRNLIQAFRDLPSHPKIYLCREIPVFHDRWGIRAAIVNKALYPLKQKLIRTEHLALIDLYTPLKHHPELFIDGIHPDSAGAALMAVSVAQALMMGTRSEQ